TPEGQSCGLIKNLSMLCEISTDFPSTSIREMLLQANLTPALELQSGTKVFVNGCWLGVTDDAIKLYDDAMDAVRYATTYIKENYYTDDSYIAF
ncbi:MAG: hypothetical protein EBT63_07360, partial [Proteobacteria bacterium]|nr:hypothetical protein [Pseudomonadota bacterium]